MKTGKASGRMDISTVNKSNEIACIRNEKRRQLHIARAAIDTDQLAIADAKMIAVVAAPAQARVGIGQRTKSLHKYAVRFVGHNGIVDRMTVIVGAADVLVPAMRVRGEVHQQ